LIFLEISLFSWVGLNLIGFTYTKKKIGEILGNTKVSQKDTETEDLSPKTKPKESKSEKTRLKPSVPSMPPLLKKWTQYCDKNDVKYGKNNLKYWEKKLQKRLTIEQQEAMYNAMNKGWKDFYLVSIEKSKYHKFLGKSLMMDRDCDSLMDIGFKENRFIYRFKNGSYQPQRSVNPTIL